MPDNLIVSISADSTKLRADMGLAQAEVKKLTTELNKLAQAPTLNVARYEQVSKALVEATARFQGLNRAWNTAKREMSDTSHLQRMTGHIKELDKATAGFGVAVMGIADRAIPHLRETLIAVTTGAGIAAFVISIRDAAAAVSELNSNAKDLGVTVQEFQSMKLVGARQGVDDFTGGLARLRREIGQARIDAAKTSGQDLGGIILRGGQGVRPGDAPGVGVLRGGQPDALATGATALDKLHINISSYKDTFADTARLYRDIAKGLNDIADGSVRAEIAGQLFGREWPKYTTLLEDFAKNADNAAKTLREANVVIGQDTIQRANQFQNAWATMTTVASNGWTIIKNIFGQALIPALNATTAFIGRNMAAWQRWAAVIGDETGKVIKDLITLFENPGARASQLNSALAPLLLTFRDLARDIEYISKLLGSLNLDSFFHSFDDAKTDLEHIGDIIQGWVTNIENATAAMQRFIEAAAQAFRMQEKDTTGGAPFVGAQYAVGGVVPGSGNGDTVPAMLTPGEFVNRQSSVAYYGADLFRALNARMIPRDMLRGWGYALGGLVDSIHRPSHYADGGMVTGTEAAGTPVHLHLNGKEFVTAASSAIAASLVLEARSQSMRSAGIKPSWVS